MSSRRKLKKNIKQISIDLISECFFCLFIHPNINKEKVNEIVNRINKINYDLVTRVNHYDGKNNKQIVKKYFNKIMTDWDRNTDEIINEINTLHQ